MFTLATRWQTNTLDRESPAVAAKEQNGLLGSLAAVRLRYHQEVHIYWGYSSEPDRRLRRLGPQVLIGYTEVATRCHVTKRVTSSTRGWGDGGWGTVGLLVTTLRNEASL